MTHVEVASLRRSGTSVSTIAEVAGVCQATISQHLARLGLTGPRGGDRKSAGWDAKRLAALSTINKEHAP
jgi:hypothetical protein